MPKEVILLEKIDPIELGLEFEVYGSLTYLCEMHIKDKFQYHSIKKLKYPFTHNGFIFRKLNYNTKKSK